MTLPVDHTYGILDSLPIGVCVIDHDSNVIAWNDLLSKWTSLQEEDVKGKRLTEIYPQLENKLFQERLNDLFQDGIPIVHSAAMHRYLLPIQQLEGDLPVYMVQQSVIRLLSHDPPRAMICIEDMSSAYSQLNKFRNEAKERKATAKLLQQHNQTLHKITQFQTNIIKQVKHSEFYKEIFKEFSNLFHTNTMMVIKLVKQTECSHENELAKGISPLHGCCQETHCKYVLREWFNLVSEQEPYFINLAQQLEEHQESMAGLIEKYFYTSEIKKGHFDTEPEAACRDILNTFKQHLILPINSGDEILALIVISIIDRDIDQETIELLKPVVSTLGQLLRTRRAEAQSAHALMELKLNAQRLEMAKREAEIATRTKSDFLANMSHEIRTPMTAILGFTEVLLQDDLDTEETKSTISVIHRNGEHLLSLINDILDISKIEAGKMSMERIKFSPVEEIQQIIQLMRSRAEKKNLGLEMEVLQPVPTQIYSDPTRFRQVLVNLIGNAIKFTSQGFIRVVMSVKYSTNLEQAPLLKVSIQDTGIGIPKEHISKIFECFAQADTSTTRKFGGTGLGLSISRNICQLLGGDLTASSEQGQGSVFTATFRLEEVSQRRLTQAAPNTELVKSDSTAVEKSNLVSQELVKNLRLLVVDDAVDNRRLIDFILRKMELQADYAEHGQDALNKVHEKQHAGMNYDVILMDMQMPVMDGVTATTILRQEGYNGKIFALTANAMSQDRQKCLEAGCNDFLTKPINRKKLEAVITEHAKSLFYTPGIPVNTSV